MHAQQAIQCMKAGKHVQVEIPLADSWDDAEAVDQLQRQTGLVCMVGHTRRFNPSHQWIHRRIAAGELKIQQMDVQTYLLPPHQHECARAAALVDRSPAVASRRAHGRSVPLPDRQRDRARQRRRRGRSIRSSASRWTCRSSCKAASGAICTLSLSFNNDGPLGTFFRYICDNGTYIARYDDLVDGKDKPIDVSKVDVSMNGIELQDREFFAAIRERREPNASVAQVLPCYRTLHELERSCRFRADPEEQS